MEKKKELNRILSNLKNGVKKCDKLEELEDMRVVVEVIDRDITEGDPEPASEDDLKPAAHEGFKWLTDFISMKIDLLKLKREVQEREARNLKIGIKAVVILSALGGGMAGHAISKLAGFGSFATAATITTGAAGGAAASYAVDGLVLDFKLSATTGDVIITCSEKAKAFFENLVRLCRDLPTLIMENREFFENIIALHQQLRGYQLQLQHQHQH